MGLLSRSRDLEVVPQEDEAQALLEIQDIVLDPVQPDPGDEVAVEIVAHETTVGEDFDTVGYAYVSSPQLSLPVIQHCALIPAGDTFTFDDSCQGCDATQTFQMPDDSLTLNIEVGGANRGTHCSNHPPAGVVTDSRAHTISPGPGDVANVRFTNCTVPVPQAAHVGETVSVTGTIANDNPNDVNADIVMQWDEPNAPVIQEERRSGLFVPAGSTRTVTVEFHPIQPGNGPVDMFVENVS